MKTSHFFASFAIVVFATANTISLQDRGEKCLDITQTEATTFIEKFATTIDHTGDWKATAKQILSKDFVFASNSYLSRNGEPIGTGPTLGIAATTRKTYIAQLAELTVSNLTTDSLLVSTCGQLVWRANVGSVGPEAYPSKIVGILTLERKKEKKPKGYGGQKEEELVATRWECEFDSIGWSLGLGLDCGSCVN